MRVLAALSGGVDSAVAAARLRDAGHDVTAVHLALSSSPASFREGARGCCSLEDSRDAARVADRLDIPYYVWDVAERFRRDVVEDFVAEYAAGRTPNPCLRCNERVKFAAVAERAAGLGFEAIATGHYARVDHRDGVAVLRRAVDPAKDQSYVLGGLTQEQLAGALFPLGESTKAQVRAEAADRGLLVAEKPDSHDICFIADGDTTGFLRRQLESAPGEIVEADGTVVGEHDGTWAFTVGQRRGLRLGQPAADGQPRYVLRIDPVASTVTVGPREALAVTRIETALPTWCSGAPVLPAEVAVQVRAHGRAIPATVTATATGLALELSEPETGVAAGQSAVLYDGDRVLGAAVIELSSVAAGTTV